LLCAVGLGIAAAVPQLQGAAFAQSSSAEGVQAFSRAVKAYEDGDWNAAAGFIDEATQAGLPKDLSARAIHLRAHIYEHSGALARALQDYSTALWMDTLPQNERKAAQDGKLRVIAAMGLNSPQAGIHQASAAPVSAPQDSSGGGWSMFGVLGSSKPAAAPPPPAPEPAPESSSGGVWNMYGIFGSSTPASPAPEPAALAVKTSGAETSASGVLTRPKPAEVRAAKAAPAPRPAPTPRAAHAAAPQPAAVRMAAIQPVAASAASAGGFMILFGSAGSESAGQGRAHQIKAALSDILVNRELEVEAGAAGGYQIVAGPYKAKSAALALCSAIKQRGISCQVTP
jgi:hypothetical protein